MGARRATASRCGQGGIQGKLGVEPLSVCNRAKLPQICVCAFSNQSTKSVFPASNRFYLRRSQSARFKDRRQKLSSSLIPNDNAFISAYLIAWKQGKAKQGSSEKQSKRSIIGASDAGEQSGVQGTGLSPAWVTGVLQAPWPRSHR
jgi:hypothetical protein